MQPEYPNPRKHDDDQDRGHGRLPSKLRRIEDQSGFLHRGARLFGTPQSGSQQTSPNSDTPSPTRRRRRHSTSDTTTRKTHRRVTPSTGGIGPLGPPRDGRHVANDDLREASTSSLRAYGEQHLEARPGITALLPPASTSYRSAALDDALSEWPTSPGDDNPSTQDTHIFRSGELRRDTGIAESRQAQCGYGQALEAHLTLRQEPPLLDRRETGGSAVRQNPAPGPSSPRSSGPLCISPSVYELEHTGLHNSDVDDGAEAEHSSARAVPFADRPGSPPPMPRLPPEHAATQHIVPHTSPILTGFPPPAIPHNIQHTGIRPPSPSARMWNPQSAVVVTARRLPMPEEPQSDDEFRMAAMTSDTFLSSDDTQRYLFTGQSPNDAAPYGQLEAAYYHSQRQQAIHAYRNGLLDPRDDYWWRWLPP